MHRYNVARSIHHRQPSTDELIAQCMYHTLMLSAQLSSFATGQDTNRCYGGIHGDRGQGSGKDEPGTIATDVVNQRLSSSDVTTDGSIGFAERSTDNIHLVHDIVTISDTRTTVAIQTHCVDLVNKCQRAILVRYITELFQRTHITCHGMNSLESNNLGCVRVCLFKQLFEVFYIIVPEDELLSATVPNALDHGCVVTSIGEYQTAR
mmetsp:Transcript_10054/g.16720  ORF Transcript_10054/g.16720 Transcript_10054/m.16720 type:complete len:207 (-) Transcript_10054:575-1195(-)